MALEMALDAERSMAILPHLTLPRRPMCDARRKRSCNVGWRPCRKTRGRFRLNVALPIAFDGFGFLDVDLRSVTPGQRSC